MSWNYRVFVKGWEPAPSDVSLAPHYAIHECYYHKKTDTIPHSWTEKFCEPVGETMEELATDLEHMKEALSLPVLRVVVGPDGKEEAVEVVAGELS